MAVGSAPRSVCRDQIACTWATPSADDATSAGSTAPTVTTVPPPSSAATTTVAPLSTWVPDGYDEIELVTSVSEVRTGDEIDVTYVCPFRDAIWEAYFQVDHLDETFEQQEVPRSDPDEFATSFVVPYWLEPGEIVIRRWVPEPTRAVRWHRRLPGVLHRPDFARRPSAAASERTVGRMASARRALPRSATRARFDASRRGVGRERGRGLGGARRLRW